MGVLEELAHVRDSVEKGKLDRQGLIDEVEKIAKNHHENLVVLYESERFDEFKKYWIKNLLSLRSLVELLHSEQDDISLEEGLYPAAFLSYFLKEAHLYVRTENGTKVTESIFLLMARVLKPLTKLQISKAEDIKTCMDLTNVILSGIESYKRKSYRQVYILPELILMVQKTLHSYAEGINDKTILLNSTTYQDLSAIFKLASSLLKYEENVSSILGKQAREAIKAVKHAASKSNTTEKRDQDSKKKSKPQSLPTPECTTRLTKPDQEAAESLISLISAPLPQLDCQNVV